MRRARANYDAALCMYHDQALIPIKALHFEDAVNVTLGLADRPHRARSWHRVRHRRAGPRRPAADGGGDPDGGRKRGPARRSRLSAPPEPLRDVIARHGLSASKALGQNFILDRQLLARIAAIPGPLEGERVYEVGPGPGGLTRALLDAGASVVAVERDRRCIPALAELQAEFGARLEIIEGDALAGRRAQRSSAKARMSSPTCPTMSAPRCCSSGWAAIGRHGGDR